jgi:hypothetical protein
MRLNRLKLVTPQLKDSDFAWWIEIMMGQDMLQSAVDLNKLVRP